MGWLQDTLEFFGYGQEQRANELSEQALEWQMYHDTHKFRIAARDLEKAGLSKTLIAGGAGGGSSVSQPPRPTKQTGVQKALMGIQMGVGVSQIAKNKAERELAKRLGDKARSETDVIDIEKRFSSSLLHEDWREKKIANDIQAQIKPQRIIQSAQQSTLNQEEIRKRTAQADKQILDAVAAEFGPKLQEANLDKREQEIAVLEITETIKRLEEEIMRDERDFYHGDLSAPTDIGWDWIMRALHYGGVWWERNKPSARFRRIEQQEDGTYTGDPGGRQRR